MKRQYSLRGGLVFLFSLIVLTTATSITINVAWQLRRNYREELRTRLHDIVSLAVLTIDGKTHSQLTSAEQEDSPEYIQIRDTLRNIRDNTSGVEYIYTMRKNNDGTVIFIVDAEESAEDFSHLGDSYEIDMNDIFDSTDPVVIDQSFTKDQWGTWLSGSGKLKGGSTEDIVGIDISADSIEKKERELVLGVLIIVIPLTLFFIFMGALLAGKISKPLALLQEDMMRIKNFELNSNPKIDTIFKELTSMKIAKDSMKNGLKSFKKYVPADLVSQLLSINNEALLGGEERELTFFFSDIANFTTISESIPASDMAIFMKSYFGGMTEIISKHGGTVDKYIGDSVMAFWGAPHFCENGPLKAVEAALECQHFLYQLNSQYEAEGKPKLTTRIGIHTGIALVGNFGYEERLNYTAFGDNVNLASRLEGINKYYGTNILVSEETYNAVQHFLAGRFIDQVTVKGKHKPTKLYEIIAPKDQIPDDAKQFLQFYAQGVEAYYRRDWKEAVSFFEQAAKFKPKDKPISIFLFRARYYTVNPPADTWDGITVLDSK